MSTAGIDGPQACPKGLRHSYGARMPSSNVAPGAACAPGDAASNTA